ncbi:MAG: helix-turn-helix domain-containing protein [Actinobacteria bacterium]|nr:helix-turn-helix domain-containing protein [Actinomycetota bacterium]
MMVEQFIEYDASPIGSKSVRREVEGSLEGLYMKRCDGVWKAIKDKGRLFLQSRTFVIGDLDRLIPHGWSLDYLAATPSTMTFVFLVRTDRDRKRLFEPQIAQSLNDEKFFLLDLGCAPNARPERHAAFTIFFRSLVERLQPDRVTLAKYSLLDDTLWLEFGDGLERALIWSDLAFARKTKFKPISASAGDHGQSVSMIDASGKELDVDAGALRSLVDSDHRTTMESRDYEERELVGSRLRAIREQRGLSQEQLSKRCGIAQESLSRIETGRRDPRTDTLRKIAAGLGITLHDLLSAIHS